MPHRLSNIPSKMFYSAFGAEILSTARTSSNCEVFYNTPENLISILSKQGGNITALPGHRLKDRV